MSPCAHSCVCYVGISSHLGIPGKVAASQNLWEEGMDLSQAGPGVVSHCLMVMGFATYASKKTVHGLKKKKIRKFKNYTFQHSCTCHAVSAAPNSFTLDCPCPHGPKSCLVDAIYLSTTLPHQPSQSHSTSRVGPRQTLV